MHEAPKGPIASCTKSPVPHCLHSTRCTKLSECLNLVKKGFTKHLCPFIVRNIGANWMTIDVGGPNCETAHK